MHSCHALKVNYIHIRGMLTIPCPWHLVFLHIILQTLICFSCSPAVLPTTWPGHWALFYTFPFQPAIIQSKNAKLNQLLGFPLVIIATFLTINHFHLCKQILHQHSNVITSHVLHTCFHLKHISLRLKICSNAELSQCHCDVACNDGTRESQCF